MSSSSEILILEPPDRKKAVLDFIRAARSRLILSVFRCQDFAVLDELAAAIGRKVRVTALLTPSAKNWDKRLKDLSLFLESMGAEVHKYSGQQAKYHAKYAVADDESALVATLNFTQKCFERTCDFILVTRAADIVQGLTSLFEADKATPPAPLPAAALGSRLLVGPQIARGRFAELITGARSSIRIIDHRVRDSQIVRLLQEREQADVLVQILGQGDIEGLTSHGKLLIIDDRIAVIGSASLARPSLDERREVSVVIEDPRIVAKLVDRFRRLASGESVVESAAAASVDDSDDEDES